MVQVIVTSSNYNLFIMFGIENFELFLMASTALNVIPGPDAVYIVTRSITQGRRAGLISSWGICTGAFIHTVIAGLGLSAILISSAYAFTVLKYLGAAYLIYLGIKSFFNQSNSFEIFSSKTSPVNSWTIFVQGVLVDLLNPKVAIFFLAFLPQFITRDNPNKIASFILLGTIVISIGLAWDGILIFASSGIVRFFLRQNRRTGIFMNRVTGIVYAGLGIKLAIEKM